MADAESRRTPPGGRRIWPLLALPGTLWIAVLFIAPLYVVVAILFGGVDPILRQPVPVWNPLDWDFTQFVYVWDHIFGPQPFFRPALVRTVVYVTVASLLCLLIAYPVAYFTARLAGRWKGLLLAALIAPFWISYMMRMLAWVNLLQTDGLVNKALSAGGLFDVHVAWLQGHASTVILGPGLRLRALHDPPAVRRPGPRSGRHAGGGPRPRGEPVADLPPGDLAADPDRGRGQPARDQPADAR